MVTLKTNTTTSITINALNVVLQHGFVPSLGWCADALVHRSATVQNKLREYFNSVDMSYLNMSKDDSDKLLSDMLDSLCSGTVFQISPIIIKYTENVLNSMEVPIGHASEMVNDLSLCKYFVNSINCMFDRM